MYLSGLKVIELASVLAAPSVGQFLAELGAEVIKIENPITKGDVTRSWRLSTESPQNSISAYFSAINWGKTSLSLNISEENNLQKLYELVRSADIILASYKPQDAEKLKVDYATLSQINPTIIYGHITGYGNQNPKVGYDAIIQAETGFMFMNGEPESPPTKMPVALIDVLAGHQLKEGILIALLEKYKTGKGSYVEVSLFDSAVSSLVNQATNWLNAGHNPLRMGSEHPNIVPYGTIFSSKDEKPLTIAVGTDKHFALLCEVLGIPEVAQSPDYQKNAERVKNREKLIAILREKISTWHRSDFLQVLEKLQIPAGAIQSIEEVFTMPESLALLFEQNGLRGLRQWAGKINGFRGQELSAPPTYENFPHID
ncbi:MAG: CoA transferase [Thermonemataceae bacterium]|nr:CoA transferase [Thermonemataceae bacterium]